MADEYIPRGAALKTVCDGCNAEFEEMPCEPGYCYIRNALLDMPAADVVARDCFDKILAENDDMRAIIDTYGGLENIQSAFVKLHEIETADVRPVVHGKWNRMKDGSFECPICGSIAPYKDNYYGDVIEAPELPFCPWCGTDMREVKT